VRERLPAQAEDIRRCCTGDVDAWRAIYEQYLPLIYRVAFRMGVPEADLPDLCQEVFLRAYRGMERFRGDSQLTTWLYSITLREAARARRARNLRNAFLTALGRQPLVPAPAPAARLEAHWELQSVLRGMKPKQREVFVLFELEELPLAQIAQALGCRLETVRSRLRHARRLFARLRHRTSDHRERRP
jgi:RNA polymerase sigma-70 factor, ECF subfamily